METDLGEVLQIDSIFANVSKGMLASAKDLQDVFGTTDHPTICKEILDKGELQVSEQERVALCESTFRDIASIVADKTINPETNRPYTVAIIQNAMRQIQFSVNLSKSSKSQALEVIRKLKTVMPIVRANMLLRILFQATDHSRLLNELSSLNAVVHSTSGGLISDSEQFVDVIVDPENYRRLEEIVSSLSGNARLDVLQLRMNATSASAGVDPSVGVMESKEIQNEEVEDESVAQPSTGPKRETRRGNKGDDLQALLLEMGALEEGVDTHEEYSLPEKNKKNKKSKNKPSGAAASLEEVTSNKPPIQEEATRTAPKTKISKKTKLSEKEEREERASRAKELHDRIAQEKLIKNAEKQNTLEILEPASGSTLNAGREEGASPVTPVGTFQRCNTCGGAFQDSKSYRDHFRSEWHRFNLKRKMKNLSIIPSEEAFLALSLEELQI